MNTKQVKAARRFAVRSLQSAGIFTPFVGYVGNGVGRRAHIIAARRGALPHNQRQEWFPVDE